jgi:hypothetical protein
MLHPPRRRCPCFAAPAIAGLWLVLPWWLPFAYATVVVWTIARRLRGRDHRPQRPRAVRGLVVTVSIGALAVLLLGMVGLALAARRPPRDSVDLTFPLGSGTYLVVNGGSQALTNAHLGTLESEPGPITYGQKLRTPRRLSQNAARSPAAMNAASAVTDSGPEG